MTMRYRIMHMATHLANRHGGLILRLDETWPWTRDLADAFARLLAAILTRVGFRRPTRVHDRRASQSKPSDKDWTGHVLDEVMPTIQPVAPITPASPRY